MCKLLLAIRGQWDLGKERILLAVGSVLHCQHLLTLAVRAGDGDRDTATAGTSDLQTHRHQTRNNSPIPNVTPHPGWAQSSSQQEPVLTEPGFTRQEPKCCPGSLYPGEPLMSLGAGIKDFTSLCQQIFRSLVAMHKSSPSAQRGDKRLQDEPTGVKIHRENSW